MDQTSLRSFPGPTLPLLPADSSSIPFQQLVEMAQDVVIVTDATINRPGPFIRYVNAAFTKLTGWQPHEVIGKSPRILQGPGSDRQTIASIGQALRAGEKVASRVLNYARNGAPYWLDLRIVPLRDQAGCIEGFAAFERDSTLDKRRLDELEYLADRDTLTGIPNRRALLRAAQAELMTNSAMGLCLAWIDIDHFKRINDTHGHGVGDSVLMGVADVLAENIRRVDHIGRMGGEEFAVCMPCLRTTEAAAVADRLRSLIATSRFATSAGPISATCSIGLARRSEGESLESLMERADAALYEAKRSGRNRLVVA